MKLGTFFCIVILFISSNCVAEDNSTMCLSLNVKVTKDELPKVKEYLSGKISKPKFWPSKGTLAATIGDLDYIKNNSSKDELFDAFYVALSTNNQMSMDLVRLFKDINVRSKNDISPLMMAVSCNRVNVARKIILMGGDVNAKVKGSLYDPLIFAVQTKKSKLVRLLIDKGAGCSASKLSNGLTLIDIAKKIGKDEIVNIIKECSQ